MDPAMGFQGIARRVLSLLTGEPLVPPYFEWPMPLFIERNKRGIFSGIKQEYNERLASLRNSHERTSNAS